MESFEGIAYNTPMNTLGIGDPVPPTDHSFGSGDKFAAKERKQREKGKEQQSNNNPHATLLPYIVYSKK